MKYKKGKLIFITRGCYSSYKLVKFVKTLKDFSREDVIQEFSKKYKFEAGFVIYQNGEDPDDIRQDLFEFMLKEKYIEVLECDEFDLGGYCSDLESEIECMIYS